MAGPDKDAERLRDGPLARLGRSRAVVLAVVAAAAAVALAEPSAFPAIAFAAMFVLLVIALVPQARAAAASPVARGNRRNVWPDASLKACVEALPFPVYVLDASGMLRYANAPATPVFGQPVIGDQIGVTFRRPELSRIVGKALAEGRRQTAEYADQIPTERWFELDVAPVPAAQGARPDFFLMSFRDQSQARRAEQMRSDFIANASHELRTPLASLRGFIETIKGPAAQDPKAMARFLDIMLDQAERMSRLIDDLLSLSRIEMKAHVRPQGRVAIADVMGNVAGALAPTAQRLGVVIETTIPAAPLHVAGDRDELIQVFENLVENACKYGDSGKRVQFSAVELPPARQDGPRRVEVAVRDFGPGIAAEHLPRLTERFYRVDAGASRQKQGTGLGLAIVKHILNRHGTRLVVTSTLGEGARFSVTLPLAGEGGEASSAEASSKSEGRLPAEAGPD